MALGLGTRHVARQEESAEASRRNAHRDFFEMANLFPEDTGLPVTVWVSPRGRARHAARIKVCRVPGNHMVPEDTVTVAIDPVPHPVAGSLDRRHLDPVLRWVTLNRDVLIRYWNGEIGTGGLIRQLQPLSKPDDSAHPVQGT
jgi:hypothetical protein